MEETDKIKNIRELLEKWYEGISSPEETARLVTLITTAESLPEDLETDRLILSSLSPDKIGNSIEDLPEMPPEYQSRISEALEKEIKGQSVGTKSADRIAILFKGKRRWWSVAACVVCLMSLGFMYKLLFIESGEKQEIARYESPFQGLNQDNMTLESDDTLTLNLREPDLNGARVVAAVSDASKRNIIRKGSEGNASPAIKSESLDVETEKEKEGPNPVQYAYLSADEEEMLALRNYRIVRDPAEADEILSSIFGRMESNVEMESCRLSRIELEYDSEMVKFANFENNITYNKEYHEEDPI